MLISFFTHELSKLLNLEAAVVMLLDHVSGIFRALFLIPKTHSGEFLSEYKTTPFFSQETLKLLKTNEMDFFKVKKYVKQFLILQRLPGRTSLILN